MFSMSMYVVFFSLRLWHEFCVHIRKHCLFMHHEYNPFSKPLHACHNTHRCQFFTAFGSPVKIQHSIWLDVIQNRVFVCELSSTGEKKRKKKNHIFFSLLSIHKLLFDFSHFSMQCAYAALVGRCFNPCVFVKLVTPITPQQLSN